MARARLIDMDSRRGRKPEFEVEAVRELERPVLDADGVVIRYGQFYGPGTYGTLSAQATRADRATPRRAAASTPA